MPFWKKAFQKQQGVYYPQAVVQGNPVETETIAKDLAKISTVSNSWKSHSTLTLLAKQDLPTLAII